MLTFIMGCFRSSCNTEEARVFSSCHRERRLMTSAKERKRYSFVPPNHHVWFGSKSAIGPRTRLCDTYEVFNYCQHVSLNYLAPAGALKGGKMSKEFSENSSISPLGVVLYMRPCALGMSDSTMILPEISRKSPLLF